MGFGGRPPIYNSVEEIIPLLEKWEERVANGEEVPTITGLTLALGFNSKDTLYNYSKNDEFSYPIKKAILIVENGYENALKLNNATGSIFALKNMGWVDKMHNDITTNEKDITPTITPDIISKLIDKL
jgi:hypothetical protein